MKITETHPNGAEIGITGPFWIVKGLITTWRAAQRLQIDQEPSKVGFRPNNEREEDE